MTDAPPRLPETETTEIAGLPVRRIVCRAEDEDRVLAALGYGAFTVPSRR